VNRAWKHSFIGACALAASFAVSATEVNQATAAADAEPLSWFKAGNYAALERYYSQQQADFETGRISDEVLFQSFKKLYEDSPDDARGFDEWADAYPRSYPAMLTRGTYEYHMAFAARGDRYIKDTARSKLEAMDNWLVRAQADLGASLSRTSKPYLSAVYLLDLTTLAGDANDRRRWYDAAMQMDPSATHVRYRYMFSLRPRWGGSYAQMQEYLQQCEAQGLPEKFLASLKILIHADRAEDAMGAGNESQVLNEWGQVLSLSTIAGESPSNEALIGYARAAQDLNRPVDADRAMDQLRGRSFNDVWSLTRVGFIYVRAHRDAEAWPILQRAAELDDPWSQFVVGSNLYNGMPDLKISPRQAEGLIWIKRAAQQCSRDALNFLAAHGQKGPEGCPGTTNATESAFEWRLGGVLTCLALALVLMRRMRGRITEDPGERAGTS
jgi:hypothetical protein